MTALMPLPSSVALRAKDITDRRDDRELVCDNPRTGRAASYSMEGATRRVSVLQKIMLGSYGDEDEAFLIHSASNSSGMSRLMAPGGAWSRPLIP